MTKLKPISRFKEDIREGDLVRVIFWNFRKPDPSDEAVGYFTCVREKGVHEKYDGRLVHSYGEGKWPEYMKGVNLLLDAQEIPDAVVKYEVLRRRKEKFSRPHDRTIQD